MHATRRSSGAAVALAVAAAMLVPLTPAVADEAAWSARVDAARARADSGSAQWQDFGVYTDAAADVIDFNDPAPNPAPQSVPVADIRLATIIYEPPNEQVTEPSLQVEVDVAEPTDPLVDPAWQSFDTYIEVLIDVTGDAQQDVVAFYGLLDGELTYVAVDAETNEPICDGGAVYEDGTYIAFGLLESCLGADGEVLVAVAMHYDDPNTGTRWFDSLDRNAGPISDTPRQCPGVENSFTPGPPIVVERVACGIGGTEPITQAIATSQYTFNPGAAGWVVLARNDDFPDALAGSALAFGLGPLLYTFSPTSAPEGFDPNRLAPNTMTELQRVLPPGGQVYILGGTAAISGDIDAELEALGYEVIRFAGASREETATAIALEVRRRVEEFAVNTNFPDLRSVIVATRRNWPDAVVAGSIAAFWGFPVLLTDTDSLHPATRAKLEELQPEQIYVVGGTAAISTPVRQELETLAVGTDGRAFCTLPDGRIINACRIGGDTRVLTALGLGELNRFLLGENPDNPFATPDSSYAIAVNMYRSDAFAHTLAATSPSGNRGGAVFIPLEGEQGHTISDDTRVWLRDCLPDLDNLILAGDRDLIGDSASDEIITALTTPPEPGAAEHLYCRPPGENPPPPG